MLHAKTTHGPNWSDMTVTNITQYKQNNPRPGSEYQQYGHTDHTPYMTTVQLIPYGSSLKRKSKYIFKKLKVNISDSDREKRLEPVIHPVLSKQNTAETGHKKCLKNATCLKAVM